MTYGEASRDLRHALADVMRWRRPEAVIGDYWRRGDDGQPAGAEPVLRHDAIVEDIRRFRAIVFRYVARLAQHAVAEADHAPTLDPMRDLATRLSVFEKQAGLLDVPRPGTTRLTRPHKHALVEAWRQAALAATTLSERELPKMPLTGTPSMVVSRDAAQLAVALLRLDGRYQNLRGWECFAKRPDVDQVVSLWTAADRARGWPYGEPARESDGLVVDQMGYRRPVSTWLPPSVVASAVEGLRKSNNYLADRLPSVSMLRYVAKGHLTISEQLRRLTFESGEMLKSEQLLQRAGSYLLIGDELRNVRSGTSSDDRALDDLARHHLLGAARELNGIDIVTAPEVAAITEALLASDRVVSEILIKALRTSWFFEKTDEMGWYNSGVIKKAFHRWAPMAPALHPELVELALSLGRDHLPLAAEPDAAHERAWFAGEIERTEIVPPSNNADLDAHHSHAILRNLQRRIYEPGYTEAVAEREAMWAAAGRDEEQGYEPPDVATGAERPSL